MNWKQSLDRYLTTPPDDGFDVWADDVINNHTNNFFVRNEDWILEGSGQHNLWLNKLFGKGYDPLKSAEIIERAFKLYLNRK